MLQTLLSLSAREDWEIHQIDIVGAYLQGDLEEEIYMRLPTGLKIKGKENYLWRLRKPIYGLKQAGHQWKVKLDSVMSQLGFAKGGADDCLFVLKDDGGETVLAVVVYVDDMAIAGKSIEKVKKFKADISKLFEISDLGELTYILGIQVNRDRSTRTISLNQTAYIHNFLARYGMQSCTPVLTPLETKHRLSAEQSPLTPEEISAYREYAKDFQYLEGIGSVLYCTQTRPNIQHAVGVLAQFGANPGKKHLEALKRVMRYLKGTAHYTLTLGQKETGIDLVAWTDSDWAQDIDSRQSIGSFVFDIAGRAVSWSSKKQPTVALSTVEAEYMAASNATKEAIWLRCLLTDLGFSQASTTVIHANNQGCIALAQNPVSHSRAKHINIRHHFIRERISNHEINLRFCSTHHMLADIFTKQLPRESFERFRLALGVGVQEKE